ncbi:MAG: hypothetical protein AVDCRST_MAG20-511 [uncultured Acidimicrobiales bacterium]|uniref:Uncharacterized protein n=1 Tax=uncultured Acidimicrobiales bacterium TaxID=310071 RepID=A0A6J4HAB5_9ACTN|nr:MAG: hypothetical protein AVDCRST_MAG20-511 [uncultured Acidimicrobiales bacterium]
MATGSEPTAAGGGGSWTAERVGAPAAGGGDDPTFGPVPHPPAQR